MPPHMLIPSHIPNVAILHYASLTCIVYNKSSAVAEMGDRLATIALGGKVRGAVPLSVGGGAGSSSNTMSPGPRPAAVPSGVLIHPTVWPQYTNVTDRTDRTTVR